MDETTLIQEGKLEPRNGVYITAAYYAQTGNAVVNKISAASKFLKTLNIEERMKTLEFAKGENPLPVELLNSSVIVSQKDKLLGCAISELQNNSLIMTEIDIVWKN